MTGSARPIVVSSPLLKKNAEPMAGGLRSGCQVGGVESGMVDVDLFADEALQQGVRFAQAFGVLADDPDGDLGVAAEHVVELRAVDRKNADVGHGDGVGGARGRLEQRHLAEEVAALEARQHVRLAADVLDDLDGAFLDDEHLDAELTLGEDRLSGGVDHARFFHRILSACRSEDRFRHRAHLRSTAGSASENVRRDVLSRTVRPIGMMRLFPW